jgi:uncharacterized protein (TIGR02466 family)
MTKRFNLALFPNLVIYMECDGWEQIKDDLTSWIYNCQHTTKSADISNRGGWQSPWPSTTDPAFFRFRDYIVKEAVSSLTHFEASYTLSGMWASVNKRGNNNVCHNHPGSDLSGVLWVKAPENCGNLTFISPNNFTEFALMAVAREEFKRDQNYYEAYSFVPKEGAMVLFPAHLNHCVESSQSDEDRISIAFNLELKPLQE